VFRTRLTPELDQGRLEGLVYGIVKATRTLGSVNWMVTACPGY
jgi:hypothetical protein